MTRPKSYKKTTEFADYARFHPGAEYVASQHDAEFRNIETSIGQGFAVMVGITRDDGKLANQIVTPQALSIDTLALMANQNMKPRGTWVTDVVYLPGDIASTNDASYVALVKHLSSATFQIDKDLGRWQLVANNAIYGFPAVVDKFSANGTQTDYDLSYTYPADAAIFVFVNGLAVVPSIDYTLINSGGTIKFTAAPSLPAVPGSFNILVINAGGTASGTSAAVSAAAAGVSAANAAASASSAAATYDTLRGWYYGTYSSDPTLDPLGGAPSDGDIYFNTTSNLMRVYSSSAWSNVANVITYSNIDWSAIQNEPTTCAGFGLTGADIVGTIGSTPVSNASVATSATSATTATTATNATNAVNLTGTIDTAVTGVTQSFGDATTKIATTAFADALRDVVANAQTTSYTLALSDRGKCVDTTAGVTVPPNSSIAFGVGATVSVANLSAGNITITQGTGVSLRLAGVGTTGNRTLATYGVCTMRKVATDTWIISGAGLT